MLTFNNISFYLETQPNVPSDSLYPSSFQFYEMITVCQTYNLDHRSAALSPHSSLPPWAGRLRKMAAAFGSRPTTYPVQVCESVWWFRLFAKGPSHCKVPFWSIRTDATTHLYAHINTHFISVPIFCLLWRKMCGQKGADTLAGRPTNPLSSSVTHLHLSISFTAWQIEKPCIFLLSGNGPMLQMSSQFFGLSVQDCSIWKTTLLSPCHHCWKVSIESHHVRL